METLFILEYQAQNDGSASALPPLGYQVTDAESANACISAFFSKCASAAISSCDTHTIMIVNSNIRRKTMDPLRRSLLWGIR